MNTFKQRILTGWHLMRILRLVLSIWILVMAIQGKDIAMGLFGAFFLYTAIAGVGCCRVNTQCATSQTQFKNEPEEVKYEEIK